MDLTGDFKVGRSSNVARRLTEVQTGCPHNLRMILHAPGHGHEELKVHADLRKYRCRARSGEWFREEGLGFIPTHLYDMFTEEVLETPDWWKQKKGGFKC